MNLRQDLGENFFDNNSKYEDRECDSAYVKYCSKSVFDKSSDKEMSETSLACVADTLNLLHRASAN